MSETLNFKLGNRTGLRLMEVAQEKWLYDYDLSGGIQVLMQTLHGSTINNALEIIQGKAVLLVDDETQEMVMVKRDNNHSLFPYKSFSDWFKEIQIQLNQTAHDTIYNFIPQFKGLLEQLDNKVFQFSSKALVQFVSNEPELLLEEIASTDTFQQFKASIQILQDYITKATKIKACLTFIESLYFGEKIELDTYTNRWRDVFIIDYVQNILKQIKNTKLYLNNHNNSVFQYIEKEQILTKQLKSSPVLSPVEPDTDCNAGWLSPGGIYYALKGEIANRLHNKIADKLYWMGIIPMDYEAENLDAWLEQQGWIRIHNNWALMSSDKKVTDMQRHFLYKYAQYHKGYLECGFTKTILSGPRIQAAELPMLNKTLNFNYQ